MDEKNLTIVPVEQLPQTDEPKKNKRVIVNTISDNILALMARDKVEMAEVQRETRIPWGTFYCWCSEEMTPLLDLNVKELADYFDTSIDFLAFGVKKYKFDTFDREELEKLKRELY
jgi:hypothetical protein